ncbi:hypothetical protein [uncultured Sunxiuqinia sp.]|uniref:hypothetical protein n=1 Tax=uncultured Sunxiuqinia sp. TaxID=1573825 RepID=UPI002AA70BA9|nr:hypothetical protein [uncultured Sunxiuqinia sp.]
MKKLILMLAIVFAFGVSASYAVNVQETKTEQMSTMSKDDKVKKEATADKKEGCEKKKACCDKKKASCDKKKSCDKKASCDKE